MFRRRFLIINFLLLIIHSAGFADCLPKQTLYLETSHLPLRTLLETLEDSCDLRFHYRSQAVKKTFFVEWNNQQTVDQQLVQVLTNFGLYHQCNGQNEVIIHSRPRVNPESFLLRGQVIDSNSNEPLPFCFIEWEGNSGITDEHGFFNIEVSQREGTLVFTYFGSKEKKVSYNKTAKSFIRVKINTLTILDEVSVHSQSEVKGQIYTPNLSHIRLPVVRSENLPLFLGEPDPLKTIRLLPGIQNNGDLTNGLTVRGGGPDQNLYLIDDVPSYNIHHLFGFLSIFNANSVRSIQLHKGGLSPEYEGRLSSVLDVQLKNGNKKEWKGMGSIGILSTSLFIEGPLIKDKVSCMISGRRTYFDLLSLAYNGIVNRNQNNTSNFGYFFYDLTAKVNAELNEQNSIELMAYFGRDKGYLNQKSKGTQGEDGLPTFEEESEFSALWANQLAGFKWKSVLKNGIRSTFNVYYTGYSIGLKNQYQLVRNDNTIGGNLSNGYDYLSGINDVGIRQDFKWEVLKSHSIALGGGYIYRNFNPGTNSVNVSQGEVVQVDTTLTNVEFNSKEWFAYILWKANWGEKWKSKIGGRYTYFSVVTKPYYNLQPRVEVQYQANKRNSFYFNASKVVQFIHLLPNNNLGLPADIWLPVTDKVPPMECLQSGLGWRKSFAKQYSFAIEGYVKSLREVVEVQPGKSVVVTGKSWDENIITGKGISNGIEFLLRKEIGKLTGWIGYTRAYSTRVFAEINNGNPFPFKYNRKNQINITATYQWNRKWSGQFIWVYASGQFITLPSQKIVLNGEDGELVIAEEYREINNFQMKPYHRMDIQFTRVKKKKWGEAIFSFGIYNVYNRLNPYFLQLRTNSTTGKSELVQYGILPITPSINYAFRF